MLVVLRFNHEIQIVVGSLLPKDKRFLQQFRERDDGILYRLTGKYFKHLKQLAFKKDKDRTYALLVILYPMRFLRRFFILCLRQSYHIRCMIR